MDPMITTNDGDDDDGGAVHLRSVQGRENVVEEDDADDGIDVSAADGSRSEGTTGSSSALVVGIADGVGLVAEVGDRDAFEGNSVSIDG